MMTKKAQVFLIIVIVAFVSLAAVAMVKLRKKPETSVPETLPPLIRVLDLIKQDIILKVSTFGTVLSRTEIVLSPEVSGKIIEVAPSFQAGGAFKKDDVLFKIDPRDYEAAVNNAKVQLVQAEIVLALEEAEGQIAGEEWASLGEGEAPDLVLRKPQLVQARVNLEAARTLLTQAQRNLARTRVKAPFSGRVREKLVDQGQVVALGTPAARIYATDYAEIRLPLPLTEFNFLGIPLDYDEETHELAASEFSLQGKIVTRQYTWSGRIVRTEAQIDPQSRMIYVVARVEDPYGSKDNPPLLVGLFVRAEITGETLKDVFVLPRSSVRGRNQLMLVDTENRLRFRTLDLYRAEREQVIVRSGLEEGELVCLTPLDTVVEGMLVRIIDNKE